jgi:hypothetical protein
MCGDRSQTLSLGAEQQGPILLRPSHRSPSQAHWPKRCASGLRSAGSFQSRCDKSAIGDGAFQAVRSGDRRGLLVRVRPPCHRPFLTVCFCWQPAWPAASRTSSSPERQGVAPIGDSAARDLLRDATCAAIVRPRAHRSGRDARSAAPMSRCRIGSSKTNQGPRWRRGSKDCAPTQGSARPCDSGALFGHRHLSDAPRLVKAPHSRRYPCKSPRTAG